MSEKRYDQMYVDELRVRELRGNVLHRVLAATFVVPADAPSMLTLDANGAGRNVDFAAVTAQGMEGKVWFVNNLTGATHALTLRDSAAATIVSVPATKSAIIAVMNGVWRVLGLVA